MEALAAIGLAGNIITFLDFGYQVLAAANDIHGSATGQVKSDDDLAFVTREMRDLSLSLSESRAPLSYNSDSEASLRRLATQCLRWSDDLLSLLEDSRAANPRSRRSTLKAAWSSARNKKRKAQLEKSLATCQEQIGIRLTELNRSELLTRLDDSVATTDPDRGDMNALKKTVEALRRPTGAQFMDDVVIEELQSLVNYSERMVLIARRNVFLKSLRFDKIHERLHNIPAAYSKTFNWLLEEFNYTGAPNKWIGTDGQFVSMDPSRDNSLRTKAREDFTHWLGKRSGLFHITGKPGAGKSTLMKFICEHPRTLELLEEWSSGKKLVIAKSFLWRLGEDMQKNLRGLLRGIVHQLIVASPDLLKIAFPMHWSQCDQMGHVELSSSQIEAGLHLIFADESVFETHCFVLFIDGLDEFDGSQPDLVQNLLTWASKYPKHVKICVSSREWNVFRDAFERYSKLRIHEYTMDGIAAMTAKKLAFFRPALPDSSRVEIVKEIVGKAHGVFIWVTVVLKVLEIGVINGNTVSELQDKIRAFPAELGDLYGHLFNSIHECDRKKAYETLLYAKHISQRINRHSTLLEYHFLDQVVDSTGLSRFKEAKPPIKIESTARRLNGHCQGFLELRNHNDNDTTHGINTIVGFMHLTAAEFLDKPQVLATMLEHVTGFDCLDRHCQTLLAQWKFFPAAFIGDAYDTDNQMFQVFQLASTKPRRSTDNQMFQIFQLASTEPCRSTACSGNPSAVLFNFLIEAQELISLHDGAREVRVGLQRAEFWLGKSKDELSPHGLDDMTFTRNFQVPVFAASECFYEYFDWRWEQKMDAKLPTDVLLASALRRWFGRGPVKGNNARFGKMAGACFRLGLSPDAAMLEGKEISWWQWLVCCVVYLLPHLKYGILHRQLRSVTGIGCHRYLEDNSFWTLDIAGLRDLFKTMLVYGASSTFLIEFSGRYSPDIDFERVYVSDGQHDIFPPETTMCIPKTSPLSSYVRNRNGRLTLRELFRFWFNDEDYWSLNELLGPQGQSVKALTEEDR
ncbi:hypothetical protein F5Y18DRAFT_144978 [Xylariaceae sp. FL1019]|nr:hypothetical protein F5Y18DRAFT_144978 [Xylariaceae sp. FL1019]